MSNDWYYVDRLQQRVGPVAASDVAEAHRIGAVDDQTLVWREGLAAWAPLSDHRPDLGIFGPPTIAPRPVPGPPPVAAGMSRTTGCLVVGAVVLVVGVPILAILAAIAVPAYQDYIARSQVTAGLADIRAGVVAFEESIQRGSGEAASPAAIGLHPASARCSEIFAEGRFAPEGGPHQIGCVIRGNAQVNGAILTLDRTGDGEWSCTVGGVRDKYMPTGCQSE